MKPGRGERAVQVLLALLKSGCYLLLFLGMQVAVMVPWIAAAVIWAALGEGQVSGELIYEFIERCSMAFSLISGVLTIMVILIFYRLRRKPPSEALWLRPTPVPTLWVGVALDPALYFAVTLVLFALPEAWMKGYNEASAGLDDGGLVGVLAVVVVAPVVEEFIFRGLIMTRLSRAMPGWLAILLSAAVFGACHGNPVWFAYAFVLGAVFGLMDWRAGSIWPSILGHVAFNAIGQVFTFLPENETAETAAAAVLLVLAVAGPLVDRKAVAAVFKPAKRAAPEPPMLPGVYEFDPWAE